MKPERTMFGELPRFGYDVRMEPWPTHAEGRLFSVGFTQAVRRCPETRKAEGTELCPGRREFGSALQGDPNDRRN